MMDSGERRRQRERDTGPLLEETHDKQVNESGRLESVCLWRNYTSKKIPPKRRRPRMKGLVTRRTCRRDWMAKNTRPMAPGQKVPRRLCAGNRPEQLTRTTWARKAGPAGWDRERGSYSQLPWIADWAYPDFHFTKKPSWLFPEDTRDQRGGQQVSGWYLFLSPSGTWLPH